MTDAPARPPRRPPAATGSGSGAHGRNTINDIARLAGVSKKTVSRVINDSPLVRPDTRDKVQALMERLGYVPDPQARGLAFRRSFLVGLVFDSPSPQYIVNLQYGVLDALRDTGFELVVHPCDSTRADYVASIRRFVMQQKLYGAVLVPRVSEDQALADMLADVGCRFVRIASVPVDDPARMVLTHDRLAAAQAADHLAALGHRRIGLITGPRRYRSSVERRAGFTEALAARGIRLAPERIFEGGYTFESGVAGAERLLAKQPRPTAIFACNDEMAAGVYKVAHTLGLAIPGDLSVVGYDDSPLAGQLWPPLTSLHLPVREIGRHAAAMLIAGSRPSVLEAPKGIAVDLSLVERDSSRALDA